MLCSTSITAELLNQAASGVNEAESPQVLVDGRVENYNGSVDAANRPMSFPCRHRSPARLEPS